MSSHLRQEAFEKIGAVEQQEQLRHLRDRGVKPKKMVDLKKTSRD